MSQENSTQQLETIGASAMASFFINFTSSQQQIEQSLLMLEMSPDDNTLL